MVSAQAADIATLLPSPTADSDKYRRGVLGLVSGSERYTGAAVLSAGGALGGRQPDPVRLGPARGGRGPAVVAGDGDHPAAARAGVIRRGWQPLAGAAAGDFLTSVSRVQAWVAGPGMGTGDDSAELLAAVLATDLPVLVDADGLTILAEHRDLLRPAAPTLITPHAGELSRLTGADPADIEAQRLTHAREAARSLGVTVLLKGSTTVICSPPDSP